MKKLILYITILGLLLNSCKKDETKVVILANPNPPTLATLPDLTLQRTHGLDTLVFIGTPVNPGFQASATYFLEACATGNNFKDSLQVLSSTQDASLKITVSALNGILLQKFTADVASSIDFRIRSVLSIDAGTGAVPKIYASDPVSANVTIFGLPRLDLINSGIIQKVESAFGDGKYTGYVKLDATKPFTLKDPDANIAYGANGAALAVNGAALSVTSNGWYKLDVDTKALTYTVGQYMISVIGAFTNWGSGYPGIPGDYFMDYNAQNGYWYITLDLPVGELKFRQNASWNAPNLNWGPNGTDTFGTNTTDKNIPPTGGVIALPNSTGNIVITAAGNYTIRFSNNGSVGTCTFIRN
jgi:hypothetical protein